MERTEGKECETKHGRQYKWENETDRQGRMTRREERRVKREQKRTLKEERSKWRGE